MHRLSINQVRNWRRSIQQSNAWGNDILSAAELRHYWGRRGMRGSPRLACILRQQRARQDAGWEAFNAELAAMPAPEPPPGRVFGFSNGTEYDCWTCYNCEHCAKAGDPSEAGSSSCAIFEMIHDAAADDGTFPIELAERMGWQANRGLLYWRCPEFEAEG